MGIRTIKILGLKIQEATSKSVAASHGEKRKTICQTYETKY